MKIGQYNEEWIAMMKVNEHLSCLFLCSQLMVDVDGKQEWRECADITGLRLPTGYFLGASSATGDLSGMKSLTTGNITELLL